MDVITAPSSMSNCSVWTQVNAALGISLMDHLFNRLDGAYPRKWRADFQNEIAIANWKETWSEAFDEDGITPTEIKAGLKNCRRMFDWPPSLTEFMRACRPELNAENAFHEAIKGLTARRKGERGEWSHPAIYYAAVDVGQYDMMNSTYGAMRTRWEKALDAQMAKGQWAEIPQAAVALPEPRKTEQSNAEAAKTMEAIGAGDVLKPNMDHEAWARKIIASPNGKSIAVLEMAKRALEATA